MPLDGRLEKKIWQRVTNKKLEEPIDIVTFNGTRKYVFVSNFQYMFVLFKCMILEEKFKPNLS